jgi:proteasome lid subunit RPN8/RPN11
MSSSTVQTTPPRLPRELYCPSGLWQGLIESLRDRGHGGKRESGAFLLGDRDDARARITDFVLYDDLDPHSLDRGIVHFDGRHYGALWEHCRRSGLSVVADVHTHPFGSMQSLSDRAHPMISAAGHIALILPNFAMDEMRLDEIGIYLYLGAKRWQTVPVRERARFLRLQSGG